jgi:PPIC-type PPIASE domain
VPTLTQATELWRHVLTVAVAAVCCAAGLTACGSLADSAAVVRVGGDSISKATVDHWTAVIMRGGAFTGARGEPPGPPKQRALALLIASDWLIGEATHQRVAVSEGAVDAALLAREHENSEFQQQLRESGQTIPDLKLELRAELAAEAIREKLSRRAEHITAPEVAAFYRKNPSLFTTGARVTDLLEGQSSPAAAAAAAPLLGTTQRYGSEAIRERVTHAPWFMRSPEKVQVVDAIFAARPGVVSRPVLLNRSWAVYVVRKVIPGKTLPFAKARAEVVARLSERRQQALASRFDRYYKGHWEARTSCLPGYVGAGCPQSTRPLGAYEDPFSVKAHALLSEPLAQP